MGLPMPFGNPTTYLGHSGVDFPQSRGTVAALPPAPGLNPAAVTDTHLAAAIQAVWGAP